MAYKSHIAVYVVILMQVNSVRAELTVFTNAKTQADDGDGQVLLYCSYTITPDMVNPTIAVDWKKDGSLLARKTTGGLIPPSETSSDPAKYNIVEAASLQIFHVTSGDADTYTCLVAVTPSDGSTTGTTDQSTTDLIVNDGDTTHDDAVPQRASPFILITTALFLAINRYLK